MHELICLEHTFVVKPYASLTDKFTIVRAFKNPTICVTYKSTSIVVNVFLKEIISSHTRDLTGFKSYSSKK